MSSVFKFCVDMGNFARSFPIVPYSVQIVDYFYDYKIITILPYYGKMEWFKYRHYKLENVFVNCN